MSWASPSISEADIDRLYEVNEAAYGKIQHTIREARSLAGGVAG